MSFTCESPQRRRWWAMLWPKVRSFIRVLGLGWDVGRRLDGHKVENGWTAKELLTLGEEPAGVGLALKLIETARAVLGVARAIRSLARHPKSRTQAINALKGCWSPPATSSASS